jgi:hypothetical protein
MKARQRSNPINLKSEEKRNFFWWNGSLEIKDSRKFKSKKKLDEVKANLGKLKSKKNKTWNEG